VDRPGVGWLLAGIGVVAMVAYSRPRTGVPSISGWLWTSATLGLLAVGAFRASEWLFTVCVLAAGATGSLAVTKGRTVLLGLLALPIAVVRAAPWVAKGIAAAPRPAGTLRLSRTVIITAVLVVVFGALFAGADAAFAHLVSDALPTVQGSSVFSWILVFLLTAAVTAGAGHALVAPLAEPGPGARPHPVRRLEWALPVGVLVLLFASFVVVQLAVLFGGRDYMLRTANLTAADYARAGFWQLSVVTVLTLVVIGVVARYAPVDTRADRTWLRGLLGSLSVLTLVIVASAISRMSAYQESYGYTVLRLVITACELWFGVVYLMVLAAIGAARLRAPWLPRAIVGSAVLALLVLASVNPDGYVADRNVARYAETGKIDLEYLGTLSVDAAPVLARLPEPARTCALDAMRSHLPAGDDWRGWNLARYTAHNLLDGAYLRPRC
jgi:hypothetical protein